MCASVFAKAKTDTRCPHWKDPRYLRGAYIMNHKKLLLPLTLCLCALLCMVVTASASEVQEHSHPVCGATHTNIGDHTEDKCSTPTWTKLYMDGDGKLCYGEGQQVTYGSAFGYYKLPAGTYYLGTDLTLNRGIQIDSNGGDVTLCLNGKMISCGTGAAIQVKGVNNKNITFTLCDCEGSGVITHTGNDENDKGGNGVDVANSNNGGNNEVAKFIMYNGHITKNKGSGVYLNDSTSFTMYGGRITQNGYNNTSLFGGYGGGVYMASEASFTMYGGNITGNYANKNGGGVHVGSETANFTMSGGSITGNHTAGSGGGVNVNAGTITVGGNVNISGNWKGNENSSISNNNANNVYLPTNSTITIEKALTGENSRIGVTTATSLVTNDTSIKIAAGGSYTIEADDEKHFTPDVGNDYCKVEKKNDGIYLTHVHSGAVSYTWAIDNTTCKAEHKCTACRHVENETVNTQKQVTQNRSCTLNELSTFTATFTNTAFARQTKENVKTADMTGHAFAAAWEHNDDKHWHKCTRDGCTGIDAEAAHTYGETWVKGQDGHWKVCEVCQNRSEVEPHNWRDATTSAPKTCTVCGATTGTKLSTYYYYSPAKTEDTPVSPKAGDPGVLLYAGLAVASLTGLAYTAKKRH